MNIIQMIIDSRASRSQPDEVAALLRKAMGLEAGETLCHDAIQKFLEREEVGTDDARLLRLYLEDNNLLEDLSEGD